MLLQMDKYPVFRCKYCCESLFNKLAGRILTVSLKQWLNRAV